MLHAVIYDSGEPSYLDGVKAQYSVSVHDKGEPFFVGRQVAIVFNREDAVRIARVFTDDGGRVYLRSSDGLEELK
jgi:hypothetical protein